MGNQTSAGFLPASSHPKPGSTWSAVLELIKPEAFVFGETHGPTPWGNWGRGGNFGLTNLETGVTRYFGSQFLKPAPPLGPFKGALSIVGTKGDGSDQAGLGISYKVPTPVGDILLFFNIRQNVATVGNALDGFSGKAIGPESMTVSATFGVAYSVSDGALQLLQRVPMPLIAGVATAAKLALDGVDADGWLGAAWRATLSFEKGKIKSINVSGVEIPLEKIAEVCQGLVQKLRKSPPQIADSRRPQSPGRFLNGGNSEIASKNADVAMAYGQSPWDVAFSTIKRDSRGALEIRGGTVNVLNHGNPTIAVAERVYELGVKYNVLALNERIRTNAQAGQIIERVLQKATQEDQSNRAEGISSRLYEQALTALMNPYRIDFGSPQLKNAYQIYDKNQTNQATINAHRQTQGLQPLPSLRPKDYPLVRSIYAGKLRWQPDLTPQPAPKPPSPSFRFPGFG